MLDPGAVQWGPRRQIDFAMAKGRQICKYRSRPLYDNDFATDHIAITTDIAIAVPCPIDDPRTILSTLPPNHTSNTHHCNKHSDASRSRDGDDDDDRDSSNGAGIRTRSYRSRSSGTTGDSCTSILSATRRSTGGKDPGTTTGRGRQESSSPIDGDVMVTATKPGGGDDDETREVREEDNTDRPGDVLRDSSGYDGNCSGIEIVGSDVDGSGITHPYLECGSTSGAHSGTIMSCRGRQQPQEPMRQAVRHNSNSNVDSDSDVHIVATATIAGNIDSDAAENSDKVAGTSIDATMITTVIDPTVGHDCGVGKGSGIDATIAVGDWHTQPTQGNSSHAHSSSITIVSTSLRMSSAQSGATSSTTTAIPTTTSTTRPSSSVATYTPIAVGHYSGADGRNVDAAAEGYYDRLSKLYATRPFRSRFAHANDMELQMFRERINNFTDCTSPKVAAAELCGPSST